MDLVLNSFWSKATRSKKILPVVAELMVGNSRALSQS